MTDRRIPSLRCLYQPVVSLRDSDRADEGRLAGYEALTRERRDHRWQAVDFASFGDAIDEIDRACRSLALRGALDAGLDSTTTLLVNVEPASSDLTPRSGCERDLVALAQQQLRIAIELTERELLARPANVLRHVQFARSCGWGVAVDDVGTNPDSLAMLPFIAPDIVKLDLELLRGTPDREQARTITAVLAHAERTNAVLLAEGVETTEQLEQARSLGATLFQGWLFGPPAPLPARARDAEGS